MTTYGGEVERALIGWRWRVFIAPLWNQPLLGWYEHGWCLTRVGAIEAIEKELDHWEL